MNKTDIHTPFYIIYEPRLRRNLELIQRVARLSGAHIIMAFKANALWKTFPIIKEYVKSCTASSLNELRLGIEELGADVHSYCPAYTDETIDEYIKGSTHITFNSLEQYNRFKDRIKANNSCANNGYVSPGLRVNPHCSVIETDLYNPALPGSRFGVDASKLGKTIPEGLEGLHFHSLCESSSYDLEKVLKAFEEQFGHLLPKLKWVNMGGGHLMTREGYDTEHLISLIKDFKNKYPNLEVILEPGSAFTWRSGDLISTVVDVVDNDGVKTAIMDVSFACHMPDTLEMPYKPAITESINPEKNHPTPAFSYRLGGNSCLSGDYMGDWWFRKPLVPGQRLTLEDMNHYTTVKTTMFNGIHHPALVLSHDNEGNDCEILREYTYQDYKNRMS